MVDFPEALKPVNQMTTIAATSALRVSVDRQDGDAIPRY